MRLNSRLLLERHRYAPELNRLYVYTGNDPHNPLPLRVPQAASIPEARKHLRLTPATPVILATVSTHYEDPALQWLNRSYTGTVTSRSEALRYARDVVRPRVIEGLATVTTKTSLVNR